MGLNLEVKQSRCENQSKHTPKPPQNTTTKTRSNPPKRSAKRLCVPRAQYSRSSQKSRRACGGVAKCEGLPNHQNHHHEATGTKVSTESCKSKKESDRPTRSGSRHTVAKREGTNWPTFLEERQGQHAPHSGQPVGLVSRTTDARPVQDTHSSQPVEQPRATADTTCGSIIEVRPKFPTPRRTTVPSLTTFPSRDWSRSQEPSKLPKKEACK